MRNSVNNFHQGNDTQKSVINSYDAIRTIVPVVIGKGESAQEKTYFISKKEIIFDGLYSISNE